MLKARAAGLWVGLWVGWMSGCHPHHFFDISRLADANVGAQGASGDIGFAGFNPLDLLVDHDLKLQNIQADQLLSVHLVALTLRLKEPNDGTQDLSSVQNIYFYINADGQNPILIGQLTTSPASGTLQVNLTPQANDLTTFFKAPNTRIVTQGNYAKTAQPTVLEANVILHVDAAFDNTTYFE